MKIFYPEHYIETTISMEILKMLKKLSATQWLLVVAAVIAVIAVYNYSVAKGSVVDGMSSVASEGPINTAAIPDLIANPPMSPTLSTPVSTGGMPAPALHSSAMSQPATASGLQSDTHGLPPSCARQQIVDPSELLPRDENSEWAKLNPVAAGDLQNVNLLRAGYHIGINSVSSSLRNANLQLRSEPPNPQMTVGPWNNSTIEPDANRRPLEIGSGAL